MGFRWEFPGGKFPAKFRLSSATLWDSDVRSWDFVGMWCNMGDPIPMTDLYVWYICEHDWGMLMVNGTPLIWHTYGSYGIWGGHFYGSFTNKHRDPHAPCMIWCWNIGTYIETPIQWPSDVGEYSSTMVRIWVMYVLGFYIFEPKSHMRTMVLEYVATLLPDKWASYVGRWTIHGT